ncbi:MAG: hypothetical protein H8F28_09150 [Fibrella sp.]|nr:hypothetical protein [Armatimonadota bacterium]
MQLQQSEKETADVYQPSDRETDTENHVQPEQTRTDLRGDFTTKSQTVSLARWVGEVACITGSLFLVTLVSRFLFSVLINVLGDYVSFRNGVPPLFEALSFLLAVIISVTIGVGVGLFANRRTMVKSLIVANVVNSVAWQTMTFVLAPKLFQGGWQFIASLAVSSLFGLLTITLTDIAVALYVARKFRKTP